MLLDVCISIDTCLINQLFQPISQRTPARENFPEVFTYSVSGYSSGFVVGAVTIRIRAPANRKITLKDLYIIECFHRECALQLNNLSHYASFSFG